MQTQLDEELKDIFMQSIYEITNDFNLVDIEVVWKHWPKEGELLLKRPTIGAPDEKSTQRKREGTAI